MSVLYIEEFTTALVQNGGVVAVGQEPAVAVQAVTFTGTAGTSSAFNAATKIVRLHTDGICSYRFSTAGTAATTSYPRMVAGQTEYFAVLPADKVSAVTNT